MTDIWLVLARDRYDGDIDPHVASAWLTGAEAVAEKARRDAAPIWPTDRHDVLRVPVGVPGEYWP